jgi:hypothetical protein
MSNLIISLISIALIAITAVIALFAMGDTFTSGGEKADYARLQNEANQIVIATELYMAQNSGSSPDSVSELYVDGAYLKNEFSGLSDYAQVNGEDVPIEWEYGFDNFVTQMVDSDQRCANVNGAAGGSDEIADIPLCSEDYDPKNPCCTF